jgi:hypothetical protein
VVVSLGSGRPHALAGYALPQAARFRSAGCCRRKPIASLFQALIVATPIDSRSFLRGLANFLRRPAQALHDRSPAKPNRTRDRALTNDAKVP